MFTFLCALVSVACDYLISRAMVTAWLWRRYPPKIDAWATCTACSGFWVSGLVSGLLGAVFRQGLFGLPFGWLTPVLGAFAGIVWVPVGMFVLLRCLTAPEMQVAPKEEVLGEQDLVYGNDALPVLERKSR